MKKLIISETRKQCPVFNLTDEMIDEIKQFKTSEEFLRAGGLSNKSLDRLAFGFADIDITTLNPSQLKVKWKDDLENVKYEVTNFMQKYNISSFPKAAKIWSERVNLSEPIDVSYEKNAFYIEDGHHRYFAAKILNKQLNVNLQINTNPLVKIAPQLSYDEFQRCIFNQVNNNNQKSKKKMLKLTATEIKKLKELGLELEQKQFTETTELGTLTGGLKLSVQPETERPFVLTDGEMTYTSVTLKSLLAFYETLDFIKVECTSLKYHEEYSSKQEELNQVAQDEINFLNVNYNKLFDTYIEVNKHYIELDEKYNKILESFQNQKPLNWVQRLFNWF